MRFSDLHCSANNSKLLKQGQVVQKFPGKASCRKIRQISKMQTIQPKIQEISSSKSTFHFGYCRSCLLFSRNFGKCCFIQFHSPIFDPNFLAQMFKCSWKSVLALVSFSKFLDILVDWKTLLKSRHKPGLMVNFI